MLTIIRNISTCNTNVKKNDATVNQVNTSAVILKIFNLQLGVNTKELGPRTAKLALLRVKIMKHEVV